MLLKWRRAAALALAAVLAASLVLPVAGAAPVSASPAEPVGWRPVLVLAGPPGAATAASRVRALGGHVRRDLPLVGGFAATVPAAAVPLLRTDPAVRSVSPDGPVRFSGGTVSPAGRADREPTSVHIGAIRAAEVWSAGYRGQGVTVAVVDTGVSPGTDLAGRMVPVAGALLSQPSDCKNLSGEPTCADNYGHGTFVAGLIAGDGAASGGRYSGVAPQAKILSVKVAGADGSADVSTVLAAIQWVVSYKAQYNIRVLNLSLSTDSIQSYLVDPFNYAVERAWDAGIAVVVSASNRGPGMGSVSKPGDDPLVITTGAVDDRGTPRIADDEIPDFTSRGPTSADGLAKPDVTAPGGHVVSMRAPGSTIDQNAAEVAGSYHRGSGTSFSAGVVSGVVALMLQRNPQMTPNQVKYALTNSARRLRASTDVMVVGAGHVDASAAVLSPPSGDANAGVVRSNGNGALSHSRAHVEVQSGVLPYTVVNGTLTAQLVVWDPTSFLLGWNPLSWQVSTWELVRVMPVVWSTADWPGHNWGGHNWGGGNWEGSTMEGAWYPRQYGIPIVGSIW